MPVFAQEAENNIETTEKTAETEQQVKLASPAGAMVRSAFVPGWGQFYSGSYYRGSLTVLGISGSIIGALLAQNSFKDRYEVYESMVWSGFHSETDILASYEYANPAFQTPNIFYCIPVSVFGSIASLILM